MNIRQLKILNFVELFIYCSPLQMATPLAAAASSGLGLCIADDCTAHHTMKSFSIARYGIVL